MTKRKLLLGLSCVLFLLVLYLLFWPVPVDPSSWSPMPAPALAGTFAPNSRLASTERVLDGAGHAPEGIALDDAGRVYGGMEDGRIMRVDGGEPELFAATGGRPLGMDFDREGNLIVADAVKGLLSINRDGAITVLSTEAGGVRYGTTNDVDIAADGTIYFSDASSKFPLKTYKWDIIEHRPNGRLLAYDPRTRSARVVLGGLYFANGVAVSPDQSFVLVVETGKYRVRRVWLGGARAGQDEIFIENLPGFPDGISSNGRGLFWLALITPRNRLLDTLLPRPFLRKILLRLPTALQPAPEQYAFVLGLDAEGRVAQNLQDPAGHFAQISSVQEHAGFLYFGSLGENAVGRLRAPTE